MSIPGHGTFPMTRQEQLDYIDAWEHNIITFSHKTSIHDFYYCIRRTLSVYERLIQWEINNARGL